ncbi:ion transporter [Deinococcus metallilatus]|uniref:Ion transporter n=1 Tax=Deinococcus metallilatus TaxID=1211322 RepID=A0AAJ5K3J8_9DEIO|nr:ion transporter [Deinococcus metallilatus]MBB5294317.1 voltage-gated potassium channel [Deinococcus metallilatus]QBY09089.1 ion transporter [Deinococcus metallilatus]RXJ10233.1 ion transporter [Deinococcus metallilatus]TLK22525.1 ion transporter [Deinococcus metallilatus]GMA16346.1 ion transporter [Deinococcus metallilatus]
MRHPGEARAPWRVALGNIIFNNDTPAGRAFDLVLIVLIFVSILVVMLDSVGSIRATYGPLFEWAEWALTLVFTVEYVLRLISARHATHYATSFFGVVDLLSILPGYLDLLLPGANYLLIVRVLRLLRIFRILKLARYLNEASVLTEAMRASAAKITVFLAVVLTLVTIIGALMYVIEGPANGYTSIPTSIYWAIVTLTTVGFGDITPKTPLGKGLASLAMILGYGILAVPTGIVTVSLSRAQGRRRSERTCPRCGLQGHDADARYCKRCGELLPGSS